MNEEFDKYANELELNIETYLNLKREYELYEEDWEEFIVEEK